MKKLILLVLTLTLSNLVNGQWRQTNGPNGGVIKCFALNGNNIYAGMYGEGVCFSSNSGNSWKEKNTGLTNRYIFSLATDGINVFAGTDKGGIFLSTDSGDNWKTVNNGLTSLQIFSIVIKDSKIFAGTLNGVFLSTNNGETWEAKNTGLTNLFVRKIIINGDQIIIGTDKGGVFASDNNGDSWQERNTNLKNLWIKALYKTGNNLLVATGFENYISTNNGQNWQMLKLVGHINSFQAYDNYIFASTGGEGIFMSSNNGVDWINLNNTLTGSNVHTLELKGTTLYAGTDRGVFFSTDNGNNWSVSNNGIRYSFINNLAGEGSNIFAAATYGIFVSSNNGDDWVLGSITPFVEFPFIISLAINGSYIFAGGRGGLFLSINNGLHWVPKSNGLTNIDILSLKSIGTKIFTGTNGGGIFVSSNNGDDWTPKNNGLQTPGSKAILSIFELDSAIIIGTYNGNFISLNNGDSWTAFDIGIYGPTSTITSFIKNGINCYIGTSGGGILTLEVGKNNWIPINNGLKDLNITGLTINGSTIFASTKTKGVFLSSNSNWIDISDDLMDLRIYSLLVFGNNLFVGTGYSGVWIRPLEEIVATNETKNENSIKIYPNPNQGEFNIEFPETIASENYRLTISDVAGQTILTREIFNQKENINLELYPGLYFIKLVSAKNQTVVKKVLVQK